MSRDKIRSYCIDNDLAGAVVWNVKQVRIRRIAPRECFRLQGCSNEYFDRACAVNSDAQLYKQADNGVTVNVV